MSTVLRLAETWIPTRHGSFRAVGYRDLGIGVEQLAMVSPRGLGEGSPLARLHSECLTGEAFGSLRCDCGPQLARSLARVAAEGGVVVHLRGHEGRGVGLVNKLRHMRCRTRESTPSMPSSSSACPLTPASTRSVRRSSPTSASAASGC